jgi:serine protease Do
VKKIVNTLKAGKPIRRGFLGISMGSLHPQIALTYGIPKNGVVVRGVEPGFPAAKAGMKANDIVYQLNGKSLRGPEDLIDRIQDSEPGREVTLKVMRPNNNKFKELTFNVTLTSYPDEGQVARFATPKPQSPQYPKKEEHYKGKEVPFGLGFYLVTSTSGHRREFDVPIRFPFGPIVSGVVAGSPAARGGIKTGQVVLRVNGQGVNSISEVFQALRPGVNRFWVQTETGEKKISLKSE